MNSYIIFSAFVVVGLTFTFGYCARTGDRLMISETITSLEDVKHLFPTTSQEIEQQTEKYIAEARQAVDAIIAISAESRTFENTAKALDDLGSRDNLAIKYGAISVIEYVHPDKEMRDASHAAQEKIQTFLVEQLTNNKALYEAFKSYVDGNAQKEELNSDQRYFVDETMNDFKRAGLDLPEQALEEVRAVKKKLQKLSMDFGRTIAQDNRTIEVSRDELQGLDYEYIATLKKSDDGNYILGVDYPTVTQVLENCTVEKTRKKLYEAFHSRGYPENEQILKDIIAARDELAQMLGYESFAALNLEDQMIKSPERAESFLAGLREKANQKSNQELDLLIKELPESVELTVDRKIKAWDVAFLRNQYKKKYLNVDEQKIAEYFPMEYAIEQLLDIYSQFMSVTFKEMPLSGVWHEDVKAIGVYSKDGSQLYGYLLLDLHPRENKYSHACHAGIVPALQLQDGRRLPDVSVVIANFTKPTADKPALLKRDEVNTFFHEFGHAMHALLGATQLGSFSGTSVKRDFVEMPSQMLEEWLWNKEILKKVSKHYKTGEPLSGEMIDNILALKNFSSGGFVTRQAMLAQYALDLFKAGAHKNPEELLRALLSQLQPRIEHGPHYRLFANFGHLTGYAAKYYGYLWSKVFALDLFETISKEGLLNPEIGNKYVQEILAKGGSVDPNQLLKNFLGREPRKDAFIRDLGLEQQG